MPDQHSQPSKPARWNGYRSTHRMRSHHEAHNTPAPPPAVLDHPLVPTNVPEIVQDRVGLTRLIGELRDAGRFAYDSEFIGEQSYFPRLCLVQVATTKKVTLVDPLAGLDLQPFWALLADDAVEKIVHAGVQDLEPVLRHLGKPPQRVFDTQIAAGFIGQTYPIAMGKLALHLTSGDVGQGLKFSQWDYRPLSPIQTQYAANDVRYLPLVRHELGKQLDLRGNASWAEEECSVLTDRSLYEFDPQSSRLRVRGVEILRPRQKNVLRALLAWREQSAREADVPPRSLVNDGVLLTLSRSPARTVADLARIRHLPRPVEDVWGQTIVDLTQAAMKEPPIQENSPLVSADRDRVESFWTMIQTRAADRTIAPALVASKREIARLLALRTAGITEDSRLTRGWRQELLADVLATI
ncbi:MAG: HRDC domain-containing protein [Phycisphaeraceae bacterium]|nr:HRDC domain-containing protein [Phycisphaeraceae bacterium]